MTCLAWEYGKKVFEETEKSLMTGQRRQVALRCRALRVIGAHPCVSTMPIHRCINQEQHCLDLCLPPGRPISSWPEPVSSAPNQSFQSISVQCDPHCEFEGSLASSTQSKVSNFGFGKDQGKVGRGHGH